MPAPMGDFWPASLLLFPTGRADGFVAICVFMFTSIVADAARHIVRECRIAGPDPAGAVNAPTNLLSKKS